jgi:hypothetical protein
MARSRQQRLKERNIPIQEFWSQATGLVLREMQNLFTPVAAGNVSPNAAFEKCVA